MSYDTTASFSLSFFDAGDNARFASRGNFRTRKFGLRPKVLHFSTRGTKTISKGIGIHFNHEDVCSSSVDQRHPAIRSIDGKNTRRRNG